MLFSLFERRQLNFLYFQKIQSITFYHPFVPRSTPNFHHPFALLSFNSAAQKHAASAPHSRPFPTRPAAREDAAAGRPRWCGPERPDVRFLGNDRGGPRWPRLRHRPRVQGDRVLPRDAREPRLRLLPGLLAGRYAGLPRTARTVVEREGKHGHRRPCGQHLLTRR